MRVMKVRAMALAGLLSVLLLLLAPRAAASAPDHLKAVPKTSSLIDLSWDDNSSDETGFKVERKVVSGISDCSAAGTWVELDPPAAAPANAESYPDADSFTPKSRYCYRVSACNGGGCTSPSTATWAVAVYTGLPLSDWLNVEDYGADGSDANDDTDFFQDALDDLETGPWRVLWVPDGTYHIEHTLTLDDGIGIQIYGESAGGVVLAWDGRGGSATDPDVMFYKRGSKLATFRNLIWDGNDQKVVAFDASATYPDVDASTAHYDSTFKNAWIGMRIGREHYQVAPLSIRRCVFEDNTFGVSIEDANALNEWFWDCKFEGNKQVGITTLIPYQILGYLGSPTGGDFDVMRGRFIDNCTGLSDCGEETPPAWYDPEPYPDCLPSCSLPYSGGGDITIGQSGNFTLWECASKGSGRFLAVNPMGNTQVAGVVSVIKSQIDDYDEDNSCGCPCHWNQYDYVNESSCGYCGYAIENHTSGPMLLIDNVIDTDGRDYPIFGNTSSYTDILGLDNEYTTETPYDCASPQNDCAGPQQCRVTAFDMEPAESLDPDPPQPLPEPEDLLGGRPVYTVTDGNNAQDVIDVALDDDEPAIVHFPNLGDSYEIASTLDLPAEENLIVMGDGFGTRLEWVGAEGGTVIGIDGYRQDGLTLRDFEIVGAVGDQITGIQIDNVNHEDARLYLHRLTVQEDPNAGLAHIALSFEDCDPTLVDIVDTELLGDSDLDDFDDFGISIKAGGQGPAAIPDSGIVIWSADVNGYERNYHIEDGPKGIRVLLSNGRSEQSSRDVELTGNPLATGSQVTIHGALSVSDGDYVARPTSDQFAIDSFTGKFSAVGMEFYDLDRSLGAQVIATDDDDTVVRLIGNIVYQDPEYSVSDATVTRAATRYSCIHSTYCVECVSDPEALSCYCPSPEVSSPYPECAPEDTDNPQYYYIPLDNQGTVNHTTLGEGLDLLQQMAMPAHYDEAAAGPYQLNLDNVYIYQAKNGIVVQGGIPYAPTALTADPNTTPGIGIDLTWVDNSGNEDGFVVERASSENGTYSQIHIADDDQEAYTDPSAPELVASFYRVAAIRSDHHQSAYSNVASDTAPLRAPTSLVATRNNCHQITLTWSGASEVETGFRAEKSSNGGSSWSSACTAGANTYSCAATGLSISTTYLFRVKTVKNSVSSAWSNTDSEGTGTCP